MNKITKAIALWGALLLGCLTLASCHSGDGPRLGSETHFLSVCRDDSSCGSELSCICGTCTSTCSMSSECGEGAACVATDERPLALSCESSDEQASCEVACDETADCTALGDSAVCDRGFCRKPLVDCQSEDYSDSDFALLGDNFLAENGQISTELDAFLKGIGSLSSGAQLRDYSSTTVTPFGGSDDLNAQYERAKVDGTPNVIILDAGGPDALTDCDTSLPDLCAPLQAAVEGTKRLFLEMSNDGVEQIVLFFYPRPDGSDMAERFGLLHPKLEEVCLESEVPCLFVELAPHFEQNRDVLLFNMGLFPTESGSTVAAGVILNAMQTQCLVP